MPKTELTENSAPIEQNISPFIELLNDREIEAVIFDLDSTLIDTDRYFHEAQTNAIYELQNCLREDTQVDERIFRKLVGEIFKRDGSRPRLINELLFEVSTQYCLRNDTILSHEDELERTLDNNFINFYKTSPEIYDSTVALLYELSKAGKKIGIHTHGQEDWSLIKINMIKEKYFEKYNEDLNIDAIHITPFEHKKDAENWDIVAQKIKVELSKILVVGDNIEADMKEALLAGYTNLIHIKANRKDILGEIVRTLKKFRPNLDLLAFSIDNIKDLFTLDTGSRI